MIVTRQEYNTGGDNDGLNRPEEGRSFYAYDGLGSVAALTNHQGNRKTRYQYDAFGEVMEGDLSQNPYAFTGKRFDTESGFYHFHFRKYDPETGVWTTPDPIGILGGLNLYRYVRNNPVRFVDRWGLFDDNDAAAAADDPQGDCDVDSAESNPQGIDGGGGPSSISPVARAKSIVDIVASVVGFIGKKASAAIGIASEAINAVMDMIDRAAKCAGLTATEDELNEALDKMMDDIVGYCSKSADPVGCYNDMMPDYDDDKDGLTGDLGNACRELDDPTNKVRNAKREKCK